MLWKNNEYDKLNQLLDAAIAGTFTEEMFDESELSKLQTKLMRYLTASAMSEKKIGEQRQKLQELITNIAHQTRTPLTNIKLYGELLGESALDTQQQEYVREICAHTDRLEQLIAALVKMSRLETGIFRYEKAELPLAALVKQLTGSYQSIAKSKKIKLLCKGDDKHSAGYDPKWTLEAAGNILDNAIKYAGEGTEIVIETFAYELFSGISITDQGPGIAEEDIPLMFRRFGRGREQAQAEGIGVGLYLAREIVEGQGGYINVRSVPGKGSTFSIYLPSNA